MPLNFLHACIWAAWIWSSDAEQPQSIYERSAPALSLIQQTKQLQELRGDFSANATSESRVEAVASPEQVPPSHLALTGACCGLVGGALGGLASVVAEIVSAKTGVSTCAISLLVGGFFGAAVAGIVHVGVFPMVMPILGQANEGQATEGPTSFFDESLFEKLESLATVVATVTAREEQTSETNEERTNYAHDQKEALNILNDLNKIEPEQEKSPEETHEALVKDFEELEEVLSHGHTSEFESAETALENHAILTEQDIAKIEGDRGEDTGVENATENGQGKGHAEEADMITVENKTGKVTLVQHTGQATSLAAGIPWTDAVVNYCIAPDVSTHIKHLVTAAISSLTRGLPCIKFVDVGHRKGTSRSSSEDQLCKKSPAVFIQSNPFEHCYAYVGMIDYLPSQVLQIREPHCASLGVIKHELAHALGMAHEQSRIDRDSNVIIHWRNIKRGKEANFRIKPEVYHRDDYDILSIMHYDNYAFARDKSQVTIEKIGAETHDVMGQRSAMAYSDMYQLADMYRRENPQCHVPATAGMGCVDALDNGNDICSGLEQCNSQAISLCCGCGGGIAVQCYEGAPCPGSPALPPPPGADCLEDVTHHFGHAYPCIYRNKCNFEVKFKCPSLTCEHIARIDKITMTYCGDDVQTEICEPNRCAVYKA